MQTLLKKLFGLTKCFMHEHRFTVDKDLTLNDSPLVDSKKCDAFRRFNHLILFIFSSISKLFK